MLKIDESISLTVYCVVNGRGGNATVVYLNDSVSTDGNIDINMIWDKFYNMLNLI
ncbi:hypothetical protein [Clostridium tarantellae]|uniref:hypothetical protein n=1 Tax=Clostridium tarantellae TaxID=39493 RepID=UPI0014780972|nr:hypothetical protein [Clostridium tarantellae]